MSPKMGTFLTVTLVLTLSALCVRTQEDPRAKSSEEFDNDPPANFSSEELDNEPTAKSADQFVGGLPCGGTGGSCPGPGTWSLLKTSCKAIKRSYARAPSGEYFIRPDPRSRRVVKAYCEMGLYGGGFTFLHPTALTQLTDAQVQAMFTDRRSVLMRYRESNGRQSYSVLQQLRSYSSLNLKLGLNQNVGYTNPVNKSPRYLGYSYLYFGFIPAYRARANSIQGLRVNGNEVTFRNCDRNPNSYIALFPNFAERIPSTYGRGFSGWGGTVCSRIEALKRHTPSSRAMPVDYFMFTEAHFGGCGCYGSTDHRSPAILATTIGFR